MTAIKATAENREILNFNNKCSKNSIKQSLQRCEVISLEQLVKANEFKLYRNTIKIGMYIVALELPLDSALTWHKLKDYGDFQVGIYDNADPKAASINLKTDARFNTQYWVNNNFFGKLRIKHLIDIIAHCARLDKLKSFA